MPKRLGALSASAVATIYTAGLLSTRTGAQTDSPTAPSRYVDQVLICLLVGVVSVAAEVMGAGQGV
jgi:hypothetical protein